MYSCYVFTHNTQILYYFWYMCRYNVIWPSQGIHVLMYTHLTCFWSIKLIRLVVCVCVYVLDLWMLCIVLWRDVFESLTCWLDLCLSSLLVAFISMCFSTLWKTHLLQAWQLFDRLLSIQPLGLPFSIEVITYSIYRGFWTLSW